MNDYLFTPPADLGRELPIVRLFEHGAHVLHDVELVSLLFGEYDGTELGTAVMQFVSMADAPTVYADQLTQLVGPELATRFLVSLEIGRRATLDKNMRDKVTNPLDAVAVASRLLSNLAQEHMLVVALNTQLYPVAYQMVYKGTADQMKVQISELLRPVVARGLGRLMLAHNHPSGTAHPSDADREVTLQILKAAQLLGIEVIDHLIIGQGNYFSMRQSLRHIWQSAGYADVVSNGWVSYSYDAQGNQHLPEREGGEWEGVEAIEVPADELEAIETLLAGLDDDDVCGFDDDAPAGAKDGQNENA